MYYISALEGTPESCLVDSTLRRCDALPHSGSATLCCSTCIEASAVNSQKSLQKKSQGAEAGTFRERRS